MSSFDEQMDVNAISMPTHCVCFNIIFEENEAFWVSFDEDSNFCVDFGELAGAGDFDIYTGDYVVIPKVEEQYLYTDNKLMRDNVTVRKIPYVETDNEQGGVTVSIAFL